MDDSVKIEIGGKERQLVINLNVLNNFDLLTGKDSLNDNIFAGMKAGDVRAMMFSGLKEYDPDIKIEDVGQWITLKNFKYCLDTLMEAFKKGMPDEVLGQVGDGKKKEKI